MERRNAIGRRRLLAGLAGLASLASVSRHTGAAGAPLRFALTPVLLTSDLAMLEEFKTYLSRAIAQPVHLISRRTYQEITALLISRQVDAGWICGYPYVAYRSDLTLVAVPVWQGRPLYESYLICRAELAAQSLPQLAGSIHAFSDPDSNSGYLVTTAALAEMGTTPNKFFSRFFYTYGHRNVVRAVSAGLATSGSVDGYVYEVLSLTEPDLVASTKVIRKSEPLGFPPIACPAALADTEAVARLREALVGMPNDLHGRRVLGMLRLDGFSVEQPSLFDGIAAKMQLVRGAAR